MSGEESETIETHSVEKPGLIEAYQLGSILQWLKSAPTEETEYETIESVLSQLVSILDDFGWENQLIEEIEMMEEGISEEDSDTKLDESDLRALNQQISQWEQNIGVWLNSEAVINVHNSGLFDTEAAMNNPQQLFDQEVWEWLPETPKGDIREACKALAANCSTATVMLALRSVEDRLRYWHKEKTGDSLEGPWGSVLGKLEDEFEGEDKPAVLSNLDYLREKRNEVNHPERSPNYSEAITTLYMTRGTINEIHEELN